MMRTGSAYTHANVVKRMCQNLRSTCAVGTIAHFVLFLAASAPHRVHHTFENLTYASVVLQEKNHKHAGDHSLSLRTLIPSGEASSQEKQSDDHLGNPGGHRHDHWHHHEHASHGNNHKHDHVQQDYHHLESTENAADGSDHLLISLASDAPLHADRPHDDAHHDKSAQTVCLLLTAAQNSHLSSAELPEMSFLGIEIARHASLFAAALFPFNPSPFSQRAPPII